MPIALTIDDELPAAPVVGNWNGDTPLTNSLTLTADWTVSADPNVSNQTVFFYTNDPTCAGAAITQNVIGNVTFTEPFTGVNGASYNYQVSATDDAGNESALTACSPTITVDTIAPIDATGLDWNPSGTTNVCLLYTSPSPRD